MPYYEKCPECREFHFTNARCQPLYFAWIVVDDHGDEMGTVEDIADNARKIHTMNHADAAEKCAERDDQEGAEYRIVGGDEAEIRVLKAGDDFGAIKSFTVSGEAMPSYSATERGA